MPICTSPKYSFRWIILFARRWFFYKGAQILWLSIYNNAPPSPSHTSNAWNTRTSSHVFFVNIPQSLLNRNSGLQCPEIGSEIPSALGLVLASISSRMRADEGRENLTWSVPEKLLHKSEWFNIIVIKCTAPALRKSWSFVQILRIICPICTTALTDELSQFFLPDGFRYWILQLCTCCQVINWHTYVPN